MIKSENVGVRNFSCAIYPAASMVFLALLAVILLSGCSSPQERSGIRTTPINRPASWEKNSIPGVSF
ncbi:MAG: hypothetical protein NT118_13485 [Lentisphaerae bacterium]|nr:hypothetical protein [Lentisphaerota bacterium]